MKNFFRKKTAAAPPRFIKTPYTSGLQVMAVAAVTAICINPYALLRFSNDLPVSTFRDAMLVFSATLVQSTKPYGVGGYLETQRTQYFVASKELKPSVCIAKAEKTTGNETPGAPVKGIASENDGDAEAKRNPASIPSGPSDNATGRYILLGDSILKSTLEHQMKVAVQAATPGASIDSIAEVGGGITRPDIVDWEKTTDAIHGHGHFDAVFIFLGTNDMQGIHEEGHGYRFGTDSWKKRYLTRVRNVMNNLCSVSDHVYWVPPPPVREDELQKQIKVVTDLVAEYLPNYSNERAGFGLSKCSEFVSPTPALAPENRFTAFLNIGEEEIKIREPDGIHLTPEGAKLLAEFLVKQTGLGKAPQ